MQVFTKNLITIPESIATLLMFPALVAIAWAVDVDLCFQKKRMASAQVRPLLKRLLGASVSWERRSYGVVRALLTPV